MKNADLISDKIRGLRDGLSDLKPAELDKRPHGPFVGDYNKARELALKEFPEIVNFAPPELKFHAAPGIGVGSYMATYTEIRAYCEQLLKLLARASTAKGSSQDQ